MSGSGTTFCVDFELTSPFFSFSALQIFSSNAGKIVHNSSPPPPHLYPPLLICRLLPCLTWNSDTMNRGAWAKLYFLKIAAMRGQDPYFPPKYPFPIPATSMGGIQPISGEFWQNNMRRAFLESFSDEKFSCSSPVSKTQMSF